MNNKRMIVWVLNRDLWILKGNPWTLYTAQEFPSPNQLETRNIMVIYQLSKSLKFHQKIFQVLNQYIKKLIHTRLRKNKKVNNWSNSVKGHIQIMTIWMQYQVNCHLWVTFTPILLLTTILSWSPLSLALIKVLAQSVMTVYKQLFRLDLIQKLSIMEWNQETTGILTCLTVI